MHINIDNDKVLAVGLWTGGDTYTMVFIHATVPIGDCLLVCGGGVLPC